MVRILDAVKVDIKEYFENNSIRGGSVNAEAEKAVREIISAVREKGDKSLFDYTERFDGVKLEALRLSDEEWEKGVEACPEQLRGVIARAKQRIEFYHQKQKRTGFTVSRDGETLGQRVIPLEKVGIYVPGGKASYPSTVLMNAVPAKVAGVDRIIMTTPPDKEGKIAPAILAAAKIAGVDEIYKVGGAQAIAALSCGTETVPKVDKIVGPGNIYVATAKKICFGDVDIDMIAGPSEILIIADETADPELLAADMLSQAEHDELASSTLLCLSFGMAQRVKDALSRQTARLERRTIIEKSLANYGAIVVCGSLEEAAGISNYIAPEHLEIMTEAPFDVLPAIRNAGSVFLGRYAPEPLGDYLAGPNHVLPTCGTARFFSPLSVDSFVKRSSFICFEKEAFSRVSGDAAAFARSEGLTAHANSIELRSKD